MFAFPLSWNIPHAGFSLPIKHQKAWHSCISSLIFFQSEPLPSSNLYFSPSFQAVSHLLSEHYCPKHSSFTTFPLCLHFILFPDFSFPKHSASKCWCITTLPVKRSNSCFKKCQSCTIFKWVFSEEIERIQLEGWRHTAWNGSSGAVRMGIKRRDERIWSGLPTVLNQIQGWLQHP